MHYNQDTLLTLAAYQTEVMKAKEDHGIMIRDPWLHYLSAKMAYETAKRDADKIYIETRITLLDDLRIRLGSKAERAAQYVERNGVSGGKPV